MKRPIRATLILGVIGFAMIGAGSQGSAFAQRPPAPRADNLGPVQPNREPARVNNVSGGTASLTGQIRLAQLGDACASTASSSRPGAVVIRGGLVDANTTANIAVPCAVQLAGGANVVLSNVTVTSQTLNISDTAFGAGTNNVTLSNSRFNGSPAAGMLLELSDPTDHVQIAGGVIDYPLGVIIQARGARTEPDSGGSIVIDRTILSSAGTDSAGVTITASTSRGRIVANEPVLASELIALFADKCLVTIRGKPLDCQAANLGAALKQQAQQANTQK